MGNLNRMLATFIVLPIALIVTSVNAQTWIGGKASQARSADIVFPAATPNPGIRMLSLRRSPSGELSGYLTSDWYGRMKMEHIVVSATTLRFDMRNLNVHDTPYRSWTAIWGPKGVHLTGGVWESEVDQTGRPATATEAGALAFRETRLPKLQALAPDGLAMAPPMGWSSWNKFADSIDDRTVRAMADAMVSTGLRDAGYRYINIDDGWQGTRGAKGEIRPNAKFPDMKALADYVHSKGLKFGIYSSPGPRTCAGYEGSYGHVAQDARTFARWGVDYLKYDLCSGEWFYADADSVKLTYYEMAVALRETGRPIVYSLCEYGRFDVADWGRSIGGHLWRTTGDITDDYNKMSEIGFDRNPKFPPGAPGGWNDPDMLEVGNGGMSDDEYRTHMTLWAISSAPLLMGHDLRQTSAAALHLLENRDVIAIDQDRLGAAGQRVRVREGGETWRKPLANGAVAVAFFNRSEARMTFTLEPADAGLTAVRAVRDVWAGSEIAVKQSLAVPAHGVILLVVR